MSGKCEHGLTTKECLVCASAKYGANPKPDQEAQQAAGSERRAPDGVWEALQRLIENAATLGPASRDDALLVAQYRDHALHTAKPQAAVPREAIGKMLAAAMNQAVANGANSISMPDELVEVAAWLQGVATPQAPAEPPSEAMRKAEFALRHARQFITNGVALGYIRMPDKDTPDAAHQCLPNIEEALAATGIEREENGSGGSADLAATVGRAFQRFVMDQDRRPVGREHHVELDRHRDAALHVEPDGMDGIKLWLRDAVFHPVRQHGVVCARQPAHVLGLWLDAHAFRFQR